MYADEKGNRIPFWTEIEKGEKRYVTLLQKFRKDLWVNVIKNTKSLKRDPETWEVIYWQYLDEKDNRIPFWTEIEKGEKRYVTLLQKLSNDLWVNVIKNTKSLERDPETWKVLSWKYQSIEGNWVSFCMEKQSWKYMYKINKSPKLFGKRRRT